MRSYPHNLSDFTPQRNKNQSSRTHGYGANSGWRAAAPVATCGATRVMPVISATLVHEEAAQLVEAAGARDEEERATGEAAYLDMWDNM
jgi:hypothetical protein